MKLIFENWRKLLNEAAKMPKDLAELSMENDEMWIRNLTNEYDLLELVDLYGMPVSDRFRQYYQAIKDRPTNKQRVYIRDYYRKFEEKLLKMGGGPPKSIIIIDRTDSGWSVSYGGLFTDLKTGYPRVIDFESGMREGGRAGIYGYPGGSIYFSPAGVGPERCSNGFGVDSTKPTTEGWGPMLYHIAIELATLRGSGLTSDRRLVSGDAKPVWDYFLKNKPDGVEATQLDVRGDEAKEFGIDQLTPDNKKDDCSQMSSIKWAMGSEYGNWHRYDVKDAISDLIFMSDEDKKNIDWENQSIAKLYTKDKSMINQLADAGLLHAPSLGYDLTDVPPPPLNFPDEEAPPLTDDKKINENKKVAKTKRRKNDSSRRIKVYVNR